MTGSNVEIAYVDQSYTGDSAADQAKASSIRLQVVKDTEAKRGFVILLRRWVVERTFGWLSRFRRLARDYERLTVTFTSLHRPPFSLFSSQKSKDKVNNLIQTPPVSSVNKELLCIAASNLYSARRDAEL